MKKIASCQINNTIIENYLNEYMNLFPIYKNDKKSFINYIKDFRSDYHKKIIFLISKGFEISDNYYIEEDGQIVFED